MSENQANSETHEASPTQGVRSVHWLSWFLLAVGLGLHVFLSYSFSGQWAWIHTSFAIGFTVVSVFLAVLMSVSFIYPVLRLLSPEKTDDLTLLYIAFSLYIGFGIRLLVHFGLPD